MDEQFRDLDPEEDIPLDDDEFERRRWADLELLLYRSGPFVGAGFTPGEMTKDFLQNSCKVLIIGAGGLGCELVKCLSLCGFRDIHLIDLDTIDLTNLNRQFLFRESDVGDMKSTVAARFITERVSGVKVTSHTVPIQDKSDDFYDQFSIIISGLDSVKARRWMNSTLVDLVEFDDPDDSESGVDRSTVKIFIDGGTEGFRGQARVILPMVSACFECTMELFPPAQVFPMCTIVSHPRIPEHCIMYSRMVEWEKAEEWQDVVFNGDDMAHVQWVFERAKKRAEEHHIRGVSLRLTQGVVKNIIPAIASTNAVVASLCANEALKAATLLAHQMDDYMMYNGNEGVYTFTYRTTRKDDCPVCGEASEKDFTVNDGTTLSELLEMIREDPDIRLENPTLSDGREGILYSMKFVNLREMSTANLEKTLVALGIQSGSVLIATDPSVLSRNIQGFKIRLLWEE